MGAAFEVLLASGGPTGSSFVGVLGAVGQGPLLELHLALQQVEVAVPLQVVVAAPLQVVATTSMKMSAGLTRLGPTAVMVVGYLILWWVCRAAVRFMCISLKLLLPEEPSVLVIDTPESRVVGPLALTSQR